MRSRRENN